MNPNPWRPITRGARPPADQPAEFRGWYRHAEVIDGRIEELYRVTHWRPLELPERSSRSVSRLVLAAFAVLLAIAAVRLAAAGGTPAPVVLDVQTPSGFAEGCGARYWITPTAHRTLEVFPCPLFRDGFEVEP